MEGETYRGSATRTNTNRTGAAQPCVEDVGAGGWISATPVDLRRAVLGLLLTSRVPLGIDEVISSLREPLGAAVSRKRVADMLRHQVRIGRARRVSRGVYEAIPEAFPKATAWRCLNWQLEQARRQQRYESGW